MLVYLILALFVFIIWPSSAFAWGPGTHLESAMGLVKNAALFSPVVAALMRKFRNEFIYGMVSADLLVAKKYAGYLHHSHNWDVAFEILKKCKTDRERASAYGYLTHLASDIVAHNYYIPYMIVKSYDARMKNHTYWELRFDVHVRPEVWEGARDIIGGDFREFDRLLESTLKRPIFSFKTNKRIFSTILLVQQFKYMRNAVKIHANFSQWPLEKGEIKHYKYLIRKITRDFLRNIEKAECLKGSPTGQSRLNYANNVRRSLRRLVSKKVVSNANAARYVERIRGELKKTMLEPDAVLPGSFEAL